METNSDISLDDALWIEARQMIAETRRLVVQEFGQIERVVGRAAIQFDPAPEALAYLDGGPLPRPSAPRLVLRMAERGFDAAEVERRIEVAFARALEEGRDREAPVGGLGYLVAVADPAGGRAWAFRLAP